MSVAYVTTPHPRRSNCVQYGEHADLVRLNAMSTAGLGSPSTVARPCDSTSGTVQPLEVSSPRWLFCT